MTETRFHAIEIKSFPDGNAIAYDADGDIRLWRKPRNMLEPYVKPMCEVYYESTHELSHTAVLGNRHTAEEAFL
jgi:hypothetical protein